MIHILDARNTIHKILQDTKNNIYRINKDYKGNITRFHLGIIFIGTNSMYQKFSYIQGKICEFMNVKLTVVHLHSYISKKDILEQIDNLNKDDTITGILIYSLPSSATYKTDYVDNTYNIDTEKNKDVDSITSRLSDIKYSLSNTLSEPDIYRTQVKDLYIGKILDGAYQLMKYTEEYNEKIKIKTLIQQYENEELFQKRLNLEKSFIHDEIIKCMEEKWNQITDEELLPRVKHGNFPKARKEYIDENLNEILLKSVFSCIVPLEIILPKRLQEDRNEIVEEIYKIVTDPKNTYNVMVNTKPKRMIKIIGQILDIISEASKAGFKAVFRNASNSFIWKYKIFKHLEKSVGPETYDIIKTKYVNMDWFFNCSVRDSNDPPTLIVPGNTDIEVLKSAFVIVGMFISSNQILSVHVAHDNKV